MEVRNAVWQDKEHTAIFMEIDHADYGWIPFTAMPNDVMEYGRVIFEEGAAGKYPVAEYKEPTDTEVA